MEIWPFIFNVGNSTATRSALPAECPVVKVHHKAKQSTPWSDADCRAVRRHARAAERCFWRTRAEADRAAWNNALKLMHSQYEKKCSNYWRDEIAASKGNTTHLWRTFRGILGEAPCLTDRPSLRRGLCFLFQGQSRRCSGIYLFDAYLRRSTQSHTDVGRMDSCVS